MEYLNEPFLTVHWNDKAGCVYMERGKFVKGKGFKDGLDAGLNPVIQKSTSRWLADLRKMQVVDPEDQKWSNEKWFTRAIKGGIRYMAILIPEDVLAKMSVDRIMEKVPQANLTTHYFNSPEEAEQWLRSCK